MTATGIATGTGKDIVTGLGIVIDRGSEADPEALTIGSGTLALGHHDVMIAGPGSEIGVREVALGRGGTGHDLDIGETTAVNEAAPDQEPLIQNAVAQDIVNVVGLASGRRDGIGLLHGLEAAYEIAVETGETVLVHVYAPTGETRVVHEQGGTVAGLENLRDPFQIATNHVTDLPGKEVGTERESGTAIGIKTEVVTGTDIENAIVIATVTGGAVRAHVPNHPRCDQHQLGKRTMRSGSAKSGSGERKKQRPILPRKRMLAKRACRYLVLAIGQRLKGPQQSNRVRVRRTLTGTCLAGETIAVEAAHAVAAVTGTDTGIATETVIVIGTRTEKGTVNENVTVTVVTGNGRGTEKGIAIGTEIGIVTVIAIETGEAADGIEACLLDGSGVIGVAAEGEAVVGAGAADRGVAIISGLGRCTSTHNVQS